MALIFKTFDTLLNASESQVVRQRLLDHCFSQIDIRSGIHLVSMVEYRKGHFEGLQVIGNEDKTKILGLAFRDQHMNRVWCVEQTKDVFTLFIDGLATTVAGVGLYYDTDKHQVQESISSTIVLGQL